MIGVRIALTGAVFAFLAIGGIVIAGKEMPHPAIAWSLLAMLACGFCALVIGTLWSIWA